MDLMAIKFGFWCLMTDVSIWTNGVCQYTRYSLNGCKVDLVLGKVVLNDQYLKQDIRKHVKDIQDMLEVSVTKEQKLGRKDTNKIKATKAETKRWMN